MIPHCGFSLHYFVSSLLLGRLCYHMNAGRLDVFFGTVPNSHLLSGFLLDCLFFTDSCSLDTSS